MSVIFSSLCRDIFPILWGSSLCSKKVEVASSYLEAIVPEMVQGNMRKVIRFYCHNFRLNFALSGSLRGILKERPGDTYIFLKTFSWIATKLNELIAFITKWLDQTDWHSEHDTMVLCIPNRWILLDCNRKVRETNKIFPENSPRYFLLHTDRH